MMCPESQALGDGRQDSWVGLMTGPHPAADPIYLHLHIYIGYLCLFVTDGPFWSHPTTW